MGMNNQPEFTIGSGNVFADLGFPEPEVALLKARLAREVSAAIREKHLTQAAAAQLLGLDQPKVSALVRGRLAGFSVERLLRCLVALERDVTITMGPKKAEWARLEVNALHPTTPTS
jgi:predicted XRE-type DNA-binding protein